jgi:RNA polymerase sigma-70 factor (ECF subfamily)
MTMPADPLVAAAGAGDESAFAAIVERHRAELHAHCYRMLGSVDDAEDALQDALLRAWRGLPRFEGRSSLRSWLYTIATNASLKAIERRPRRVLPVDFGPASAGTEMAPALEAGIWIEPYPAAPDTSYEERESLELAFIAAVQHLPARQRAVLLLRDVLGYSAAEAAASLETTVAAVNSALQRARKAVAERRPARSQQATLRTLGDDGVRRIVERYMGAWERGDVDTIVALLAEDADWAMPPTPTWYHGHESIAVFCREAAALRWRHVATSANGQPAVGCYLWDDARGHFALHVLDVLTLDRDGIAAVTAFIEPAAPARFALPDTLPAWPISSGRLPDLMVQTPTKEDP